MKLLFVLLDFVYQEQQSPSILSDTIKTVILLGLLALIIYMIVRGVKHVIKSRKIEEKSIPKKTNITEQLKNIKELYDQGILTQDEFDEQKKKILNN